MISIKEVAQKAGVSISTVSNVINKKKYVSEDLAKRVLLAVEELGYYANPFAQKMKLKQSKVVGIITVDLRGMFYPYILKGVDEVLNELGYQLIAIDLNGASNRDETAKKLRESISDLIKNRVDGIIFPSMVTDEEQEGINAIIRKSRLNRNTAFVCIEKNLSKFGIDSIFTDSIIGANKAASHLIDIGCRHIGHITGPIFYSIVQDRIQGYKNALFRNGFDIEDEKMISNGDYTHQSGYLAMKELLLKMPEIDGVFIANDQMSVGAMKAISEAGKKIPEDIKVIGYDDVFIASVLEPSLSTIHIRKQFMGKRAAELLIEQIENPLERVKNGVSSIELESKLMIRKSTVKNAADDWIFVNW
jgi:DNA-binding LacI/PurR family transcriptional regulator